MNNIPEKEVTQRDFPSQVVGSVINSWPHYSITTRLPEIGHRLLKENNYSPQVENEINALIAEIPESNILFLNDEGKTAETAIWNSLIKPHCKKNWLEAPWFFLEFYFYRRILDIVGYFCQGKDYLLDPYQFQKRQGFKTALHFIEAFSQKLSISSDETSRFEETFKSLIYADLLGNKVDLSLWPVDNEGSQNQDVPSFHHDKFIVDQTDTFMEWFLSQKRTRIDFIIDNAGFELLCDLLLADFLISRRITEQVVFHVKPYPIFVSDVIEKDVNESIQLMMLQTDTRLEELSKRLENLLKNGSFRIKSEIFWGLPHAMWDMPNELYSELSRSDLIISKGDANYRRLLGDRLWPYETPLHEAVSYLPAPLLVLRMLKSEIGVGYSKERIKIIKSFDNLWMQNGQWGSVQYFKK